ncbi:MAG: amidase [Anaerolineales bacterium]|nr:amidase [Anaerolineales bacterium]
MLTFMNLPELIASLRSGQLLLSDYLAQLEAQFAEREPDVQAFMPEAGRWDRLNYEAQLLLEQYPAPEQRPALFGVPVGVKDIFRVDGFITTAGSQLPPEVLHGTEAASVTRLKQAGALILGKTVTTEFAYFGPGPTRNPHHRNHTPGGSSSGSAAAVAAGLTPLTLGTQTIGSIVRPASYCGVVGFKPSYERVSREGVIPLSPSLDHIGPFANDVAGVQLAASVLLENWRLEIRELARPAFGIPDGPYLQSAEPEMLAHFEATVQKLSAASYSIRRVAAFSNFDEIQARQAVMVSGDAARVHAEWFSQFKSIYHPRTAELIERGQQVSDAELEAASAGRAQLRDEITTLMTANGIDIWLAPSAPGPAPAGLESTGKPIMNLPWTQAGLPALNLPSGLLNGLPVGLQLIGGWHKDEELLTWASEVSDLVNSEQ